MVDFGDITSTYLLLHRNILISKLTTIFPSLSAVLSFCEIIAIAMKLPLNSSSTYIGVFIRPKSLSLRMVIFGLLYVCVSTKATVKKRVQNKKNRLCGYEKRELS